MVASYRPNTLQEALEILNKEECIIFSGGTDLMVKNKRWTGIEPGFQKPVVFVGHLEELRQVKRDGQKLSIGAACTCTEIADSELIPEFFNPVVLCMASPAIRNIATIGGNICNSSPAGDTLPLLYALEAKLVFQSINETRKIPIKDFILSPGRNVRESNEILKSIEIDLGNINKTYHKKVGTRKSIALSKASLVGVAAVENGKIEDVRIAVGSCGPRIIKDKTLEEKIISMGCLDENLIKEIKKDYSKIVTPIDDQRSTANYRKKVVLRILGDFLKTLN